MSTDIALRAEIIVKGRHFGVADQPFLSCLLDGDDDLVFEGCSFDEGLHLAVPDRPGRRVFLPFRNCRATVTLAGVLEIEPSATTGIVAAPC